MQVYIELVMLTIVVMLLCVLSIASMAVLMCFLLTCVAYLVAFSIEMTCTKVSYCWVCVSVSWFTLFLMSFTSLVVAVLVSQLRTSPKKGKRLLLCCIMSFCQLTAILVTALLNATAEAASDNREFTRVFHQTISP